MLIDITTKVTIENDAMKQAYKQQNRIMAMGHVGTHLDTYNKSDIPLAYFKSKGIIIDVSDIGQTRDVEMEDIQDIEIEEEMFVLFKTGQMKKYGYGNKDYFNQHPQLSHKVIKWLLEKHIRFIGIDCAGIRRGEEHQPADRLCEENGVYVIENLSELEEINNGLFTVYTMWLDDAELTGLRCRVIVEQNESTL